MRTGKGTRSRNGQHQVSCINAYIFKNLNVKIYQNKMYQTKSVLKRDFSPSHNVVVILKISEGL